MVFNIDTHPAAVSEIAELSKEQQEMLFRDYAVIRKLGLEFVRVRKLRGDIFEIKTGEIRSLFSFRKNRIILVGVVFVKKSQKTPEDKIILAEKRLGGK